MSKYMIKASYSPEGMKGVMAKGGTARVEAIERLVGGVGGSMESFYFAFGNDDVYVIVDAPNAEAMAAVAGTVLEHRRSSATTRPSCCSPRNRWTRPRISRSTTRRPGG